MTRTSEEKVGGNGGKRKGKTRFVSAQNQEINRSLDFQISGPISKAISGPIKIMVNQVHYPYSGNLSLSLSSSLSNKWVNKWANKWQIRRTVNDPNLLHDQIFFRDRRSHRKCLRNKAADVLVNAVPTARSDMGTHRLQGGIFRHITCGGTEDVIQDHGEVYDVTHHASNVLLAGVKQTEQPVGVISVWSLTCLDIYRQPNLRTCLQIHSSHYPRIK